MIEIKSKEINLVSLKEIKLNPKNRNKHPKEQIDRLVDIIKYQGFRRPVTISNRTGLLSCGEGRYLAAKKLKMKDIPAIYQDYESEEQEYADGVADNAIDKWAELDMSGINNDIGDLGPDFNLDLLGIKNFTIDVADKETFCDEDEVPEFVEPKAKLGDVYQLGNHRLMCGDSTSITDVEKLMNCEKAELCFTSPPYADQREYNGGKELNTHHLATFIRCAFNNVKYFSINLGYSRKNGEVNAYWDDYLKEAKDCGLKFLSWNIWDKGECGSIGNQTAMFAIQHEWIFVLGPNPKELNLTIANKNFNKLSNGSIRNADGSVSKVKNTEDKVRKFSQLKTILLQTPQKARNHGINHPAMFPVEFPEHYIEAMTNFNESIYEPFGGSGSTLIACEKTDRRCFMMELDPHYIDVIVARWEKYTGKTAELLNGKA